MLLFTSLSTVYVLATNGAYRFLAGPLRRHPVVVKAVVTGWVLGDYICILAYRAR
jgi:hypothetical protein